MKIMDKFPDILVGMQLVGWNNDRKTLTVKDNVGKVLDLVFDDSDEGDCCGYNDFFAELLVSDGDLHLNPIIVNVECESDDNNCWFRDGQSVKITFLGEAKKLFCISSESSSGSGWQYGARVTVKCDALDLLEYVTSW